MLDGNSLNWAGDTTGCALPLRFLVGREPAANTRCAMYRSEFAIDRLDVAGIPLDFMVQKELPRVIERWRHSGHQAYIVVTNPHALMICRRDEEMRRAITGAELNLPDGVGVILASELLGYGRRHRVTGPALMLELCDQGRKLGYRHFFHGGGEGIAERLAERLCQRFPGLQVAGTSCPPFRKLSDAEDAAIVDQINATKPDIIWVGLGAPKQEKWMAAHAGRIDATAMIGVGAAFDFHSGNIAWAPRWVRRAGMEWAWRLLLNPRRMWRRNLDSPLFMMHVMKQALAMRCKRLFGQQPQHQEMPARASTAFALPLAIRPHPSDGACFRQDQAEPLLKRKAG